MCFKIFNSSNRQEFVINEDKSSQFTELDQKVNSLVTKRQNAWFGNFWFGKSIKQARIERMEIGKAIIQDSSPNEDALKKVKEVFNKEIFKQLVTNNRPIQELYTQSLRLLATKLPNIEATSLSSIKEFHSKGETLSTFSDVYNTPSKGNADLEFIIQLGDSIFKVKGMGMENGNLNGTGAFGRVFLGTNIVTGDKVAIKVARPPPKQTLKNSLEREAKSLLAVHKLPHTVGSSNVGIDYINEFMFGVMKAIDGAQDLFKIINTQQQLSIPEKIKILSHGATALEACHDNKIIHRDIKLENLLIDSDRNAYLIDFGFARNSDDQIREVQGTPEYLAPEVLEQQENQTTKTDSFSYGIMMYELFDGFPPDYNKKQTTMLQNRLRRNGLTGTEQKKLQNKSIPQNIIDIINRCLKKHQGARPTMTEVKDALLNPAPHQTVSEKTENFYENVGDFFQSAFQGLNQEHS
jgi:tRNA A-37 threonylcarbamoyl transferase component Bud32